MTELGENKAARTSLISEQRGVHLSQALVSIPLNLQISFNQITIVQCERFDDTAAIIFGELDIQDVAIAINNFPLTICWRAIAGRRISTVTVEVESGSVA